GANPVGTVARATHSVIFPVGGYAIHLYHPGRAWRQLDVSARGESSATAMFFRRPQGHAASRPCAMLYFSGSIVPRRLGLAADVTSSGLLRDGRVDAGGSPDVSLP